MGDDDDDCLSLAGLTTKQLHEARANATVWHMFEMIDELLMHRHLTLADVNLRLSWVWRWGATVSRDEVVR